MIEKNIRLQPHHSRDLLVGRRSDGRRPKYQPPGRGGRSGGPPSQGGGSPSGGGGGGGGGGNGHPHGGIASTYSAPAPSGGGGGGGNGHPHGGIASTYSAPAPAPAPTFDYEGEAYGTPDTIASLTPGPSPHRDREANIEEQKEIIKEQVLKQKIVDPTDELTTLGKEEVENFERAQDWDIVNELVDKGADFEDLNTLMDQGLLEKSSTQPYVQDFGQNNLVKSLMAEVKPKSGLLKTLGNVAMGIFAPQLLAGTKFAKPYQLYRQYQMAKKYLPKGLTKTLAKKFKYTGPKIDTQKKATKKLVKHEPKDGDRKQIIGGEDVVTETAKKFAGHDLTANAQDEYRKRRRIVQDILNKGSYQGKELTGEQRNQLRNYIEQISKFLVDPMDVAYGGRIDKALGGRSRDIG